MKIRLNIGYLAFYLFFLILFLLTSRFPFFWDTIQLASKHAHFFYETNFSSLILPNGIDSGHIPALGIYLALVWKIAGKSLLVSHFAMLPFVMGIVYQAIILIRKLFRNYWFHPALIILLADPALLAQCTLVSPDVLLMFFFLTALNSFMKKNKILYSVALVGLTLSSMRGMMAVAALFLAEMVISYLNGESVSGKRWFSGIVLKAAQRIRYYIPALLIAATFLLWHFYKTGWIGYHKDMPWYPLFQPVNFKGAIRNVFILGWRLVDSGRIFIWITGIFCVSHFFKNKPVIPEVLRNILIILVCVLVPLAYSVIFHTNLSGHRYLLPVYLLVALAVTFYLFVITTSSALKKAFFVLVFAGLISGNFWIYPDQIAKGWDSTLGYLPYFHLREKMMNYMKEEDITPGETGTLFPNSGQIEFIDLSGSKDSFAELDMKTNEYVFYSNVFNGFSDNELAELNNHWKVLKRYQCLMVKVVLYESPQIK